MSVLTCAEVRELAPELALGILGGAERAEVVLHVNGCARCQAYVAELTEAADAIPQLVPEAEPPAGFEARVLHRLDDDGRRVAPPVGRVDRRGRGRGGRDLQHHHRPRRRVDGDDARRGARPDRDQHGSAGR